MAKKLEFLPVGDVVFVPPGLRGVIKEKTDLPCGGARLQVEQEGSGDIVVATIRVKRGGQLDINLKGKDLRSAIPGLEDA